MHYFSQESAVNFTDLLQDVDKQMTVGVVAVSSGVFRVPYQVRWQVITKHSGVVRLLQAAPMLSRSPSTARPILLMTLLLR